MKGTAHALSEHIEKSGSLSCNQHIAFAKNVTVDDRRPEILGTALESFLGLQSDPVFFLQVLLHNLVSLVDIASGRKANADNLLPITFMAPGIVPESRMEPEME